MSMSRPSESFDPETMLQLPGQYIGVCTRVKQGLPNYRYPTGKKMIAIEFTIDSPNNEDTNGKIVSILCTEALYIQKDGTKSHYLKHAEQMGVEKPMSGFDPQKLFLQRKFSLICEQQNGRVFVSVAVPYVDPKDAVSLREDEASYGGVPVGGQNGKIPF